MKPRERLNDCVFCKIVHGEIPAYPIKEGETYVAIKDIHPKAPTHILFIAREHVPSVNEFENEDGDFVAEVVVAAKTVAKELGVSETGYRIVINTGKDSGQEVPHLHVHLLAGKPLGHMG